MVLHLPMHWDFKLEIINEIATAFWKQVDGKRVIAFHGNMGAGKTTFIHALCDVKKVKTVVGSPSFSLINEYIWYRDGKVEKIYHLDLYRIKDEQEAVNAGIEDCLYSGETCFIEWPEKAVSLLPPGTLHVFIEALNEQTRRITIGDN